MLPTTLGGGLLLSLETVDSCGIDGKPLELFACQTFDPFPYVEVLGYDTAR